MVTFPCLGVKMVPIDKVKSNDYNPNSVQSTELELLYLSILSDGVTQPVVVFHDKDLDQYVVVDGFHRYVILRDRFKCTEIPVVVIDKDITERMASTVRHNRARGKHQVALMGDLVRSLVKKGKTDEEIAQHLGMSAEEMLRLKQITGIAQVLKNKEYASAWEWKS